MFEVKRRTLSERPTTGGSDFDRYVIRHGWEGMGRQGAIETLPRNSALMASEHQPRLAGEDEAAEQFGRHLALCPKSQNRLRPTFQDFSERRRQSENGDCQALLQ